MKHIGILIGLFLLSIGSLSAAKPYNLYHSKNTQFDFNLLYKSHQQVAKSSSQKIVPKVGELTSEEQENANYAYLGYLAIMHNLDVKKVAAAGFDMQRLMKLYNTESARNLKTMSAGHSEDLEQYKKQ